MADAPMQNTLSPEPEAPPAPFAWQPFTPRGIAAFNFAGFGRLFLVELVIAALAAGTVIWFLSAVWFPSVREGLNHLPEDSRIVHGELQWPREAFEILHVRRPFIAFIVDLKNLSRGNPGIDLSVQFGKMSFELWSPFGCLVLPYTKDYQVEFNRREAGAWWGAWEPIMLGWVGVLVPICLLLIWALLATLYFAPCWVLAFYTNRALSWSGAWRVSSAALMPGAVVFMLAVVLYGLTVLDFFHLLLVAALHIAVGWVYLVLSVLQVPRLSGALHPKDNPFTAKQASE